MGDTTIDATESGASLVTPIRAGEVKKGMMAMLKGFPCKVIEITTSKTGKHGHAKAKMTGIDIFTGKKVEDISPSSHTITQPVVSTTTIMITDIGDDGYCTLMNEDGDIREDLKLPTSDSPDPTLGENIREALKEYEEHGVDVMVVITKAPKNATAKEASEVITAMKKGAEA